jgi:2-methylisocitrate lyase-like PEP mutase family enzyme
MKNSDTEQKIQTFRQLHQSGCFIMPNPWDAGSAKFLEKQGFKAVATTSGGFAFSKGLQDSVTAISSDMMISHVKEIVESTSLPVNADFQNGYADEPDKLVENVLRCLDTGVSGFSIEDATGDKNNPLYEHSLAVERIRAARGAIDSKKSGVVLTARCEVFLVGVENPLKVALERLTAFADAGADCLFAPGVRDINMIEELVKTLAPKPVNALVTAPGPGLTFSSLASLGVRRISVGSSLERVAWGALIRAVREISEKGEFTAFADAAPFDELNRIFE